MGEDATGSHEMSWSPAQKFTNWLCSLLRKVICGVVALLRVIGLVLSLGSGYRVGVGV